MLRCDLLIDFIKRVIKLRFVFIPMIADFAII